MSDEQVNGRFPDGSGCQPTASAASASSCKHDIPNAGTRLYAVPTDSRMGRAEWVRVTKVGRRWLTLVGDESGFDWGRCDKDTLEVDGGNYTARHRLYRSAADYEQERDRKNEWHNLRQLLSRFYVAPSHLSLAAIRGIVATIRDSDGGSAEDPKGLNCEAAPARAEGIAQLQPENPDA